QAGVSYGTKEYTHIDNGVVNGIVYEYKLESIDYNNSKETFGPIELKPIKRGPGVFLLRNNYPNPFKNRTAIKFDLPEEMRVALNIYNLQGRLVRRLIRPDKRLLAASHQVFWDGKDDKGRILASGPYIYRLSSEKYVKSRMMIKLD
ncbi:MAG: T9SS type A sorting domain-containing protein, partial [Fibrobacter sp.]|nr:T9SS type A sorting domain-containing protein [Fibrobacter sp.]